MPQRVKGNRREASQLRKKQTGVRPRPFAPGRLIRHAYAVRGQDPFGVGRRGRLLSAVVACLVGCALLGPADLLARGTSAAAGSETGVPATGLTAVGPCADPQLHLRCPDLVMSAPFDVHVDRTSIAGHVLLRAASSVNNLGAGPLELRAHRRGAGAWIVEQAIYGRGGRRHLFESDGQLIFKFVRGYRYGHPTIGSYSYWKFRQVAAFQLWTIDARLRTVHLVRVGPKVDYCLRDLIRTHPMARSPVNPVYLACSQDPRLHRDVLGTSVGWSDVYPYEYPQQWIDVTGLRGRFAFVMIADPRDVLLESNKNNNASMTYVELPSGRIIGQRVGVPAP